MGALERVLVMLDAEAPGGGEGLVSASGYYAPDARFSPEVNGDRVRQAVEVAARWEDPAESGRMLSGWWAEGSEGAAGAGQFEFDAAVGAQDA